MLAEKIDRVLIAVKDIEVTSKFFAHVLGLEFDEARIDQGQQVKYRRSAVGLELIQSTSPDGPVAKFLDSRGEGLYSVILKVPDIRSAIAEMQKKGLRLVANPRTGGLEEAYFHPRDAHGVMIVLCEYKAKHGATVAEAQS